MFASVAPGLGFAVTGVVVCTVVVTLTSILNRVPDAPLPATETAGTAGGGQ